MRLVLFDVDGTLVTARGAGRAALARALLAVYGTTGPLADYDFRGKTDPRIVVDVMTAAGIPTAVVHERLAACFTAYVQELEPLVAEHGRVQVLPGVGEVVRALTARSGVVVGLLTGNIEPAARLKLGPTGLWPFFRVGAFGSDDADRRRLPAVARARVRDRLGADIPFAHVTIVGDTPLDIDCARACGARAAAVATGLHARDELAACAPDLLFDDLADAYAAAALLLEDGSGW